MLDEIVVHKLEEGVITVEEGRVTYFNESAYGVYPQLEKGGCAVFLKEEFPEFQGTKTSGSISFSYKKIPNGQKLHYIFTPPKKQALEPFLTGKEMVHLCQLVAKESEDILGQVEWMQKSTLELSRIKIHASRLQRMADMLHHSLEALYVEPSSPLDLCLLLEDLVEECQPIFSATGVTVTVEKTEHPVHFFSKKTELQRVFFLLFSVYGRKAQKIHLSCEQMVRKVNVTLQGEVETQIKGLELHCLEDLLEGLEGKILLNQENPTGITLQFKVERLPTQLQSGNQGRSVPLLGTKGSEKAVFLPSPAIFMANCLPEDYFWKEKPEEDKEKKDNI